MSSWRYWVIPIIGKFSLRWLPHVRLILIHIALSIEEVLTEKLLSFAGDFPLGFLLPVVLLRDSYFYWQILNGRPLGLVSPRSGSLGRFWFQRFQGFKAVNWCNIFF
jgi:hypothetical protein